MQPINCAGCHRKTWPSHPDLDTSLCAECAEDDQVIQVFLAYLTEKEGVS